MTETSAQPVLDHTARPTLESLVSSLARLAARNAPAYTYVDYSADRAGVYHTLTWSEFYERVLAVAARIRQVADGPARVAVLCPQDLSYPVAFFGALVAGTVAVPLFAPEVSSHGSRLVGALGDCEPEVWLTSEATQASVQKLLEDRRVPRPTSVIAVDSIDVEAGRGFEPPAIDLGSIAYLQYTSGSTRDPAGAVITHEAVATNVSQAAIGFGIREDSTCVGWIPFFHDMGLVLLACMPVGTGARSVFSTPFDFVRRPLGWLEGLARHPNVITAAPNFAFDYAVDRVSAEDRARLDLSGVRVAINGSEPVRPRTVARFAETFAARSLGPYGSRMR